MSEGGVEDMKNPDRTPRRRATGGPGSIDPWPGRTLARRCRDARDAARGLGARGAAARDGWTRRSGAEFARSILGDQAAQLDPIATIGSQSLFRGAIVRIR